MTNGKTIALTRQNFVGKVMSLLFNMLSRLVITFLPRTNRLFISWLQSASAVILEAPQNKVCHYFHCFPIYLPWRDGMGCQAPATRLSEEHMDSFWVLFFRKGISSLFSCVLRVGIHGYWGSLGTCKFPSLFFLSCFHSLMSCCFLWK